MSGRRLVVDDLESAQELERVDGGSDVAVGRVDDQLERLLGRPGRGRRAREPDRPRERLGQEGGSYRIETESDKARMISAVFRLWRACVSTSTHLRERVYGPSASSRPRTDLRSHPSPRRWSIQLSLARPPSPGSVTTTTSGHEDAVQEVANASSASWNASLVPECERLGRSSSRRILRLPTPPDSAEDPDGEDGVRSNESLGPVRARNDENREMSDSAPTEREEERRG